MKWFRKAPLFWAVLPLTAVSLSAAAVWQGVPLRFNFSSGWSRWIENVPANSDVEKALYRLMQLPGGDILFRRSPNEAVPALTSLQAAQKADAI